MTARRAARPGHRTTRAALASAALVTVAVAVTGCELTEKVTETEQTYTVDGKAAKLDVTTPGGHIYVVADDTAGDGAKVTERIAYGKRKPSTRHSLDNGTLKLTADNCGGVMGKCSVTYEVRVAPSAAVKLATNGGDIDVKGAVGAVDAHTSGGNIDLRDCAAKQATAKTEGGDIEARFTAVPDRVDGRSSGGQVTVRLPQGRYAVDATTDGGERTVTAPVDSGSPHRVTVHSDGGDVEVLAGR
ncbi:hypothetical protein A6A06_09245 [Streptomyces sp. CB02923]|uniref:DUF4097 family beta strand repeat-containing protein n=1 Tax=Streptomyces sp. CB02923 TaxID=1718985 RepID=UPI00093E27A0|nr:DUF4097 family beta strand repeat-containing protein [Streptomyces sp. CB02923]OKI04880.1 hypothetical protein A6A06_09245 [Streptomyces sp. CB02923]